jgi:hypothetical protein
MAGYGGNQFQDPNLVGGGQGGFNQQQAGGSDQDAIKHQKIVPPPHPWSNFISLLIHVLDHAITHA